VGESGAVFPATFDFVTKTEVVIRMRHDPAQQLDVARARAQKSRDG
jgi:hypothetical protein